MPQSKKWLSYSALEHHDVILMPSQMEHLDGLIQAVEDGRSYLTWYLSVPTPDEMKNHLIQAIENSKNGSEQVYTVFSKLQQKIVGLTKLYNISPTNKRALIGYTWYAQSARRTGINTQSKFLLLELLFDQHNAICAEFTIHSENTASRKAVERLGASHDGTIRNHQILPRNGKIRHTAIYTITQEDWQNTVKDNLIRKIKQHF